MNARYEIGSFFEKEDLIESFFGGEAKESFYDWLIDKGDYHFFESGRSAISAVISDIEKKTDNKVCLIPAYTCDTVVIPFSLKGWEVYFYQLNENLEPMEDELLELIREHNPSVIFTILYYGNDSIEKLRSFLKKWEEDEKHFCIEDLTQAIFYLEELKSGKALKMKYQTASLRKWLPVSDGGMSTLYVEPEYTKKDEPKYSEPQNKAQELKKRYLLGENVSKEELLSYHRIAESALDERYEILPIDPVSYQALRLIDWKKIYHKRHENAVFLKGRLDAFSEIDLFIDFDEAAAPLYVPIIVENREAIQGFMSERGVFLPVLWPVPEEVGENLSPFLKRVYENMLAIPCDHRYSIEDMEHIVRLFEEFYSEGLDV